MSVMFSLAGYRRPPSHLSCLDLRIEEKVNAACGRETALGHDHTHDFNIEKL